MLKNASLPAGGKNHMKKNTFVPFILLFVINGSWGINLVKAETISVKVKIIALPLSSSTALELKP